MQIFEASQIHAWDDYTIRHEPIPSILLMERVATACFNWLLANGYQDKTFSIFCGKGNNGGDGLAIARMLANTGHNVSVYILEFGHKGTDDFQQNLAVLHETTASISFIPNESTIPHLPADHVIIDAILGSGLNRPLEGLTASLVNHLNSSGNEIIAIDIPTGMFADKHGDSTTIIRAKHTLTFQLYKLAFLLNESEPFMGELHVLDVGLHPGFAAQTVSAFELIDEGTVRTLFRKRQKFSHKGDYGNGGLVVGSKGLMGAAMLCARAFMRSGAGKLTCYIPEAGYDIMQTGIPEAMCVVSNGKDHIKSLDNLEKYDSVGLGPGLGIYDSHGKLLENLFSTYRKPLLIDADALNILSRKSTLVQQIPPASVITPHTREFERIFGTFSNDYQRIEVAMKRSQELNIVIVLKGPHTLVATPSGKGYFNSTGNPGMATGGSGDVLSGVITSLMCQGYSPQNASIVGVYIHGLAGDIAVKKLGMQSLIASDIVEHLGEAFKKFE